MPEAGRRKAYKANAWTRGRVRDEVYRRDGYRCVVCKAPGKQIGGTATLSLQHLRPERVGGASVPSNLVTLCLRCHGKADGARRYR